MPQALSMIQARYFRDRAFLLELDVLLLTLQVRALGWLLRLALALHLCTMALLWL